MSEKSHLSPTVARGPCRCTGSWEILAWGEDQLGEVLVGGSASWGTLTCLGFSGHIFYSNSFLSNEYKNKNIFLNKIYSKKKNK